jgi:hypothetical protein
MLAQTRSESGALRLLADCERLPLAAASCSLLLASLGDPYNTERFWNEAARVCVPGADLWFTTPAYDWARSYRSDHLINWAEFVTRFGEHVLVPSIIIPRRVLLGRAENAGFTFVEYRAIRGAEISGPLSWKFDRVIERNAPLLEAYRLCR